MEEEEADIEIPDEVDTGQDALIAALPLAVTYSNKSSLEYLIAHPKWWIDVTKAMFSSHSLVQHQINSFNQFMHHMLPSIIHERKQLVVRGKKNTTTVQVIEFGHVTVSKPTIVLPNKSLRAIFPHECRKRGVTYGSNIYVDVVHEVYEARPEWIDERHPYGKLREQTKYIEMTACEQFPIMVGSDFCYTHEKHNPYAIDECIHDPGGYFIVNGNEKSMIGQLNLRYNYPFVTKTKTGRFPYKVEMRAYTERKIRSTSTMYINLTRSSGSTLGSIFVVLPFIEFDIPLATMFRLLGVSSLKVMRDVIVGVPETDEDFHLDYLVRGALVDMLPETATLEEIQDYIGEQVPMTMPGQHGSTVIVESKRVETKRKYISHIVLTECLPHIGLDKSDDIQRRKVFYLGFMIRKLLLVATGRWSPDDKDHLGLKRLNDAGMLCALQYRVQHRLFLKNLQKSLYNDIEAGNYITLSNHFNAKRVSTSIRTAFSTGDWSTAKGTTQTLKSVVQSLMRTTPSAAYSQLRRLHSPLDKHAKTPAPRQLHNSYQGIVDPNETPEGDTCGLICALALSGMIRTGTPSEPLLAMVEEMPECICILRCSAQDLIKYTRVFVNGNMIAMTKEPDRLCDRLRSLRRCCNIPLDTSVAHFRNRLEIWVTSDAGGFFRPLICLEYLPRLVEAYQKYKNSPQMLWTQLLTSGVIQFIDKEEEKDIRVADFPHEVLQNWQDMQSNLTVEIPFNYMVIHPCLSLGICASGIVFPDKNQSPRNTYQSAMGKQADGIITSNYLSRLDTRMHILYHPEKPLVSTQTDELFHLTEKPAGENVLVAVMARGSNQEDSVILNRTSIDMGMFRSASFQTVREQERSQGVDKERICNPKLLSIKKIQNGNYESLQADGLPAVGALIQNGDVYLGKIVQNVSSKTRKQDDGGGNIGNTGNNTGTTNNNSGFGFEKPGSQLPFLGPKKSSQSSHLNTPPGGMPLDDPDMFVKDISQVWREEETARVDTVMISTSTTKDDCKYVRIRFRSERIPEVGDKFSSRHGQKGICGAIWPEEDMPRTADGLVPDLLINPHAFPSRMTIAHIFEMVLGNVACIRGERCDGTAFNQLTVKQMGEELARCGMNPHGQHVMYCGISGEQIQQLVFMGTIYYQRLKHQVIDKIHARTRGARQMLTRQPQEGRAKDGGLRFGEMERDCMIGHGAAAILRDRLHLNSDSFPIMVCKKCGLFCIRGRPKRKFHFSSHLDESENHFCKNCASSQHVAELEIPYGFKLFVQELLACHVAPRLVIEDKKMYWCFA